MVDIYLQCIVQVFIPLRAVIKDIVIMHHELLPLGHRLGGHSAGDVAVDGVVQVSELAVAAEAVVHLVPSRGCVVLSALKLDRDVHISPA